MQNSVFAEHRSPAATSPRDEGRQAQVRGWADPSPGPETFSYKQKLSVRMFVVDSTRRPGLWADCELCQCRQGAGPRRVRGLQELLLWSAPGDGDPLLRQARWGRPWVRVLCLSSFSQEGRGFQENSCECLKGREMTAEAKRQGCLLKGREKRLCLKWEEKQRGGGRFFSLYLDGVRFHLKRLWPGVPQSVCKKGG